MANIERNRKNDSECENKSPEGNINSHRESFPGRRTGPFKELVTSAQLEFRNAIDLMVYLFVNGNIDIDILCLCHHDMLGLWGGRWGSDKLVSNAQNFRSKGIMPENAPLEKSHPRNFISICIWTCFI